MSSQNIHLFDEKGQDWFKILTEYDHQELSSIINDNELKLICSIDGSHGLRYFNNKLEYSTDEGITWVEIQTGSGGSSPSEISDINGLQDALDSKVDSTDLTPIQEDITNIQTELATKGTVKSVNGELPDANGNVVVNGDTSQVEAELQDHLNDDSNPHNVTKEQIGLGNVDNTADIDKPISKLVQTALDDKVDNAELADIQQVVSDLQDDVLLMVKSVNGNTPDTNGNVTISTSGGSSQELDDHIADTENPHNVTASQIGLGNVDNTSDLDKPISTATQLALDSKLDSSAISPIEQNISDLEVTIALKGNVKTVNGVIPDANGNVEIQASGGSTINVVDSLTSTSTTDALSANMGKTLNTDLTSHKNTVDVVNTHGHVQIDDVTIKLGEDGKIYSVNNTSSTNVVDNLTSSSTTDALSANQGRELKSLTDANATNISNNTQRISTLETTVGNINSVDEKVKMNSTDTEGYLEDKLDGTTVQNINNKIVAKSLDGLTSTVAELNLLTGATSNIQAQINALSRVGNFSTSVNTYADLVNLNPSKDDMVIVLDDESKVDSPTTIYIHNGASWIYSGKFEGGQIRDFTTDPLNLDTETKGLLPKSKYEKQNASETSVLDSDNIFTSTNVEGVLKELNNKIDSSQQSIVLNDTVTSTSTTEAATANAVRRAYELANTANNKTSDYTLPNATTTVLGGVKVGTNVNVSSGTISVNDASTTTKGVVQLDNTTTSTSTTLAATANSVKTVYDLANSKASTATYTATIGTTWTGTTAPYTQTITVSGMLSTDTPFAVPVYSTTNATALLEQATWSKIGKITTANNSITVTCFEEKPTTALSIRLKVVR